MAGRELERAINQLGDVKATRRQALAWGSLTALSAAGFAGASVDLHNSFNYYEGVRASFDESHPPASEEIKDGAKKYKELQGQVVQLSDEGNLDAANQLTQSEEYAQVNSAYVQKNTIENARKKDYKQASNEAIKDNPTFLKNHPVVLASTMYLGLIGSLFGIWEFSDARRKLRSERNGIRKSIEALRPEWLDNPPDAREIEVFDKGIKSLPPIGGKIDNDRNKLLPSFTAEEKNDKVIQLRRNVEMGEKQVQQDSVQGRLPDRFKYAAIALILHSPHITDWGKPFINSAWGQVAPLIHDGGNVQTKFNRRWENVEGRTDFFKISFIEKPKPDTSGDRKDREINRIEAELNAQEFNQAEEERLRRESKFYQRVALALHAENGSAPGSIPDDVRSSAASVWRDFEREMKNLLEQYGANGVGDVKWFLDTPRQLSFGMRREADYPPIQAELIKLEEIKSRSPELRVGAAMLMAETTRKIDRLIGLSH